MIPVYKPRERQQGRQTDRQTDRQIVCQKNNAYRMALYGKEEMYSQLKAVCEHGYLLAV